MEKSITFEAHEGQVLDLLFTGGSRSTISAGMDNLVQVWSVGDWQTTATLEGHEKSVNAIALSPDGDTLVSGSSDATVKLWSLSTGKMLHTLQDRKKPVSAVAISSDGDWIASGWYGGRAVVWTIDGERIVDLKAGGKNLSTVAISADGTCLATGGLGGEIKVWEIPSGALRETLTGHETAVSALNFMGRENRLVSLGYEGTIRVWSVETWEQERLVQLEDRPARRFVLSANEARGALSLEGRVQIWDTGSWEPLKELTLGTKAVGGMAFSPDCAWFAAGGADGRIRVWEMV
jgi:WD40 repeat protein